MNPHSVCSLDRSDVFAQAGEWRDYLTFTVSVGFGFGRWVSGLVIQSSWLGTFVFTPEE